MNEQRLIEILDEHGCPELPFDEKVTMYYPAIIEAMEAAVKEERKRIVNALQEQFGMYVIIPEVIKIVNDGETTD